MSSALVDCDPNSSGSGGTPKPIKPSSQRPSILTKQPSFINSSNSSSSPKHHNPHQRANSGEVLESLGERKKTIKTIKRSTRKQEYNNTDMQTQNLKK